MYIRLNRIIGFFCLLMPLGFLGRYDLNDALLLVVYYILFLISSKYNRSALNIMIKGLLIIQFIRIYIMQNDSNSFSFLYSTNWSTNTAITGVLVCGILSFIIIYLANDRLVLEKTTPAKKINPFYLILLLSIKLFFTLFFDVGLLNSTASSLSFIDLLIPDIVLWFFILNYDFKKSLKVLSIVLILCINLFQQSKAVIFEGIFAYLIILLLRNHNPLIKISQLVRIIIVSIIALFSFFYIYVVRKGNNLGTLSNLNIDFLFGIFTGRLSYIDGFVLLNDVKITDLQNYTNISTVLSSVFAGLLPAVSSDSYSIGNSIGFLFQGVPQDYPHSGALGLFPLLIFDLQYLLTFFVIIMLISVICFLIKNVIKKNKDIFYFFMVSTSFYLILSGNIDRLVINLIAHTTIAFFIYKFSKPRINKFR